MKNKIYLILIIVIIINNILLIKENYKLQNKLENISFDEEIKNDEVVVFKNIYNISNSKYIDKIENISIISDMLTIKFKIDENTSPEDIAKDTKNILNLQNLNVRLQDDEYMIAEIENRK